MIKIITLKVVSLELIEPPSCFGDPGFGRLGIFNQYTLILMSHLSVNLQKELELYSLTYESAPHTVIKL